MSDFENLLDRAETALRIKVPFLSSLVQETRVIVTDELPSVACVSPNNWVYVNPDKISEYSFKETVYILAHETMHAASMHGKRTMAGDRVDAPWTLAKETVVNGLVSSMLRPPQDATMPKDIADLTGEDVEEIKRMNDVDIYNLLLNKGKMQGMMAQIDGDPIAGDGEGNGEDGEGNGEDGEKGGNETGDFIDHELEGEVVQEGGDFNEEGTEIEEQARRWEKKIAEAAMQQKLAGEMPAGLRRYVDDILTPDLDVRALIKQQIHNGIGRLVINNWRRPSRKHPKLPGHQMLTTPTVWCLIDCSGSISEDELKLFLGAAYEFASMADIKVISWDAEAFETVEARNKAQVISKVASKLQGGGGTKISPALKRVLKEMSPRDVVGAMTDGAIFDWSNDETKELLRQVKAKASSAFICTTGQVIEHEGWKTLEVGK